MSSSTFRALYSEQYLPGITCLAALIVQSCLPSNTSGQYMPSNCRAVHAEQYMSSSTFRAFYAEQYLPGITCRAALVVQSCLPSNTSGQYICRAMLGRALLAKFGCRRLLLVRASAITNRFLLRQVAMLPGHRQPVRRLPGYFKHLCKQQSTPASLTFR
jgi:hypothetical protein